MKHAAPPADQPLRAALYIRVSSEEQAMHGLSLPAQRAALTDYAAAHSMKVAGLYADEGVTARRKYRRRAAFMRMLTDVQQGQIDVILFIKLDRWFRNIADYYEVQRILDAHGVQWIATEERYDTTTANGRLNLNIRLSIAQDESDRTSERIKFVFADKVRRGEVISGKVPLGYRIAHKRLVPDPKTAPVVQDIFSHYLDCRSIRATRQYVLDHHGLYYSPTGLRVLLQNERYIGRAHGEQGFCPALIDPAHFEQVQRAIQVRAQRSVSDKPARHYLFSGLVFCAECGNRLSGHVSNGYVYYRCTRHAGLGLCTHKKNTSERVLERWLLENLYHACQAYNAAARQARATPRPVVDAARVRRKLDKLKDLYLNDLIDRDTYARDYAALQAELSAQTAAEEPLLEVDLSALDHLQEMYTQLDRTHQQAFWSRTLERITITNDDRFTIVPARGLLIYK